MLAADARASRACGCRSRSRHLHVGLDRRHRRAGGRSAASGALSTEATGADDATAAPFADAHFGPRYTIEAVVVRGNRKTATSLILAELSAIGLRQGNRSTPPIPAGRGSPLPAADARLLPRRPALGLPRFLPRQRGARGRRRGARDAGHQRALSGDQRRHDVLGGRRRLGDQLLRPRDQPRRRLCRVDDAGGAGRHAGVGLRLRGAVPAIGGPYGLSLTATGLYNDGSEFYRVAGPSDDADPSLFIATRVRRAGGCWASARTSARACTPRSTFARRSSRRRSPTPPPAGCHRSTSRCKRDQPGRDDRRRPRRSIPVRIRSSRGRACACC